VSKQIEFAGKFASQFANKLAEFASNLAILYYSSVETKSLNLPANLSAIDLLLGLGLVLVFI
jgi:hypothetical protein